MLISFLLLVYSHVGIDELHCRSIFIFLAVPIFEPFQSSKIEQGDQRWLERKLEKRNGSRGFSSVVVEWTPWR
jgi:hypothetical protein